MNLQLNGEPVETGSPTISALLQERGLDPRQPGIAVALNGEVIPRPLWDEHPLNDGDDLEVITAMQGG
jgi:sulfur carrier protein